MLRRLASSFENPCLCFSRLRPRLPSRGAPVLLAGLIWSVVLVCSVLVSSVLVSSAGGAEFELRADDRVVLLGDALIEQEQYSGWLELALTTAFPQVDATFRNLGWNADTPAGKSRFGLSLLQAGHEPAEEGWKQLQLQLEQTRPTVLIVGYGMASALEGGMTGVASFQEEMQRLLDFVASISPEVRIVLLSPLSALDATQSQRSDIDAYAAAIEQVATQRNAEFVDVRHVAPAMRLRTDPIHLNDDGYRELASVVAEALGILAKPGQADWRSSPQAAELRKVILQKNTWWFHRSRPANMAYVFGFRKHEQGQNAVEIPKFDELIVAEERRIADLRRLQPVTLVEIEPQIASKVAEFTEQPTPEFTIADGWEVSLWAENPQLSKPIHMNFDPQGRLWVASSEAYPMIEVGQSAPDKVLVLEDTTGDGKADRSTVFADGLLIPTGVVPGEGGAYVAQSTDLLFLKDTDGDGRADVKRRVLSGFGTEDTHHNLHTLVWGPDGRLYMNQSVYTRTDTETPQGVVRLKAGGGFRFDTRSLRLEIVFRGLWNAWGHQFDAHGQSFLTDGAGFDGVAYTFPGACFNPTPRARRQLELISPGKYPKFASLEIVSGDSFPADWQGSLVTCDFRANRVTRFSLLDQGAGFVTQQEDDLLRTSASSFRPIDVKQGPDGALYIADWSNPIINHGEVDFRDPRRDRWHGRIWRVSWKGGTKQSRVDLTTLPTEQLLDELKSNDRYRRDQSRRVLVERGEPTQQAVTAWLAAQTQSADKLQGLWLQQALNGVDPGLLQELINDADPQIRAAATRVLNRWSDPSAVAFQPLATQATLPHYRGLIHDAHPRVRLEAIVGLAQFATVEAGWIALEGLSQPMDRFSEYVLAQTVDQLSEVLMAELERGVWPIDSPLKQRQLEFLLTSIEPSQASRFLTQHLADEPLRSDGAGPWIELIGKAGGVPELNQLSAQACALELNAAATVRALHALGDAFRLRKLRPENAGEGLERLMTAADAAVQMAAIELAGDWKLAQQVPLLAEMASRGAGPSTDPNPQQEPSLRGAAIEALADIGNRAASEALEKLSSTANAHAVRVQAVRALARTSMERAVKPFFDLLTTFEDEQAALELWRGVLSASNADQVLAAELPTVQLTQVQARAGLRAARDGGRNVPELAAALLPLSGMSLAASSVTPERLAQLAAEVLVRGDAVRGERLYRKQELACATCHAIAGIGGRVGPDMTSLGASAPLDYIIESLFNPNAKIKEGFHSVTVATEDGMIVSGIEVSSSETELVIRDIANQLVRIPQNEISAKKAGMSLMPVGVIDRLSDTEQLNLIAFLAQLGKPGPFDASQAGVARRLEVLAGTHRVEQLGLDSILRTDATEGWQPLNSLVNGDYTQEDLKALTAQPIHIALVHIYLRSRFEVAQAGTVNLQIDASGPFALWIDGIAIEGKADHGQTLFETRLAAGSHTLHLRLDARDLPKRFRLMSRDVTFATE